MDAPPFTVLPDAAVVPVPVDWEAVESWLGVRLPADYKALAAEHGPPDIGGFIWLHAPGGCSRGE
jgi:hypothetical protein